MSSNSSIEWTDTTWNPVVGCTWASPGCDHCYAARMTRRLEAMGKPDYAGLTSKKHFNGTVRTLEHKIDAPLHWKKPRRVFVNSMSDLFHKDVPFEFIDQVFAVMALTPRHTYQVLTKRPERMAEYLNTAGRESLFWKWAEAINDGHRQFDSKPPFQWPLPNVWLGTSVEDQQRADERIPHLLKCPAAVRFLSVEPMLGAIDLRRIKHGTFHQVTTTRSESARIHWVIVGGESGPDARPMHPDWARLIRDQCQAAGPARVAFFFKQWGNWTPIDRPHDQESAKSLKHNERWMNVAGGHGFHGDEVWRMRRLDKKSAGRLLDGREWNEMPGQTMNAER